MPLVLASGSPRRRVLLGLLVSDFEAVVPEVDESLPAGDLADGLAAVALRKARAVAAERPDAVVLAADTLVEKGGTVLGKAADEAQARTMLAVLQDAWHRVLTGLAVVWPDGEATATVTTRVRLGVPDAVLDAYVASQAWRGKAGAYGAQDAPLAPHITLDGPWSNVVGLPLAEAARLLREAGTAVPTPPAEADLIQHNPFLDTRP